MAAALVVSVGLVGEASGAERKPAPWMQIPLDSLGFPGVSNAFLGSGSSVLTVHFLDSSHLLVTFALRKLVPRVDQDPEDHEDRLVGGVVVELPSGRVLARTEWHMHDHGRYLWSLRNGRFLLRIGEGMYTMAPLKGLESGDAFARTVFPGRRSVPSLVEVSPEGGVVTVETMYAAPEAGGRKVVLGDMDSAPAPASKAVIDFFRVGEDSEAPSGFVVKPAGTVLASNLFLLAVDADGYLWAEDEGSGVWGITFDGFGGKTIDLGRIQSSCRPRLQMTSRSEFVAMTCQGSDDRIKMTSYGLDGTETWEEVVGNSGRPTFAFAPAAARFAVSGDMGPGVVSDVAGEPNSGVRQDVRVYQNASGDLLLRVECTPAFKTAENFDLSPDGVLAAVVREGAIAVYKLAPLSKRDHEDIAEVGSYAPPVSLADVSLKRLVVSANEKARRRLETQDADERALAAVPETSVVTGGAVGPPRKPPTLLKAGEKPEFGAANAAPE